MQTSERPIELIFEYLIQILPFLIVSNAVRISYFTTKAKNQNELQTHHLVSINLKDPNYFLLEVHSHCHSYTAEIIKRNSNWSLLLGWISCRSCSHLSNQIALVNISPPSYYPMAITSFKTTITAVSKCSLLDSFSSGAYFTFEFICWFHSSS